jgi:hypothetical protein
MQIARTNDKDEAMKLQELWNMKLSDIKELGFFEGMDGYGALSKLHHIAVNIRGSAISTDFWRDLSEKTLGINNATRWNSWNALIDAAIEKQGEVIQYCQKHIIDSPHMLTTEDWSMLQKVQVFLAPFTQITQQQQKSGATLDEVLSSYDILLLHTRREKVSSE